MTIFSFEICTNLLSTPFFRINLSNIIDLNNLIDGFFTGQCHINQVY